MSQTLKTAEAGNVPAAVPSLSGGTPGGAVPDSSQWDAAVNPPGLFMTEDHRYYFSGAGPYPSVTTILKVLDKPAVTQWVARESVKALIAAIDNGWLEHWTEADFDGLVGWAMDQPREMTDVAAKLGTSVHTLAEMEGRDRTAATVAFVPDEAIPYLEAFRGFLAFLEAQGGIIVSSEKAVLNLTEGYGGTYDLLVQLDGALWLLDVKTSKGYYPEYALQLAGYGAAEFIALPGDPTRYPMPRVDCYGVLHLRPDAYPGPTAQAWRLIEYPVDDRDVLAFLAALYIWQWKGEGRFTQSILRKAIYQGQLDGIGTDPLATE